MSGPLCAVIGPEPHSGTVSHFLGLISPAVAYSPGLWKTDLSVLQFQETCNANVTLVGRAFIKKWNMSCSDMRLVQGLGDLCRELRFRALIGCQALGSTLTKEDPLQGILDFWNWAKEMRLDKRSFVYLLDKHLPSAFHESSKSEPWNTTA